MSYKDQDAWLDAGEIHLKPVSSSITHKVIDAFPKEEHSSLAAAGKKTTLRLVLRFLHCDLNTYKDAAKKLKAKALAASSRSYKLPHRADHKGPTRKLVLWWNDVLPMVVQHVLALQQELTSSTSVEKGLYSADSAEIGLLSMAPDARADRRLHSVVNSLVADNPLAPGAQEDTAIEAYCLAKLNLTGVPTEPSILSSLELLKKEVSRSLTKFRELVNHDLTWVMGILCHKDTVEQFKLILKKHIMTNGRRAAQAQDPILFTALPLYDYLKDNCSVNNDVLIQALEATIKRLYRKNGVPLSKWLEQYASHLEELRELSGGADLTDEAAKDLWKLTWGKNVNSTEFQLMVSYKDVKSNTHEWDRIKHFATGKFNVDLMTNFLVSMAPIFKNLPPHAPDSSVREYNRAHYRDTLTLDPNTINYDQNPQGSHKKRLRDQPSSANHASARGNGGRARGNQGGRSGGRGRGGGHNPRRNRGPQTSLLTMKSVGHRVDPRQGCTHPICRQGGERVFLTHTSAQCKRAPQGAAAHKVPYPPRTSPHGGKGGKGKGRGRPPPKGNNSPSRCRICSGNHQYGQCPLLAERNNKAKLRADRLSKSPQFQNKLRQYFTTPEEFNVVAQIAMQYDMLNVCLRCSDHNCDGFCNPSLDHRQTVARVQQVLGDNADDLGNSMRLAINDTEEYQDPARSVMAPVNAETFSYYSSNHYEGQGEAEDSDNFMNQSITMGAPLTGFMNQSIFRDTAHDQPSILTEDHNLDIEDQQHFNDEEQCANADPLGVPYDPHSQGEGAQDVYPVPSEYDHDDLPPEDGTGNYMDQYPDPHQYFTVGVQDDSNPHAVVLDQHMGLEVYSPVYSLLTAHEPDTKRISLIMEANANIITGNGTKVQGAIKLDSCNSRFLAGAQFCCEIKSCYEYGLPPVRMRTTSKEPTSWKRDAGLLKYEDENGVLNTSLVYIDYDNPDLILMDMGTLLDSGIDLYYHGRTSRTTGVTTLRRNTTEPYHYKDYDTMLDPWQAAGQAPKPAATGESNDMARRAATDRKSEARALRRSARGSTKIAAPSYLTEQDRDIRRGEECDIRLGDDCACHIRRVDSLDIDAYNRFVDGVSELSLKDSYKGLFSSKSDE